ncbi:DUF2163 domain-containing protein [Sphingomonas sp. BGYR3]|uniref:DUF2163 domain-containing protein n=1 Tax=Sphingomonas sp. BGYR3 TaxID=2975483 RepID=UPI0021A32E5D|nr:DUF2163 domain-containing protein [Sphingomonas sp. BGYR3]MDG5489134.1 DUF2163 domain-containing protein [Sphingomonas sp. BGYR3]
MAGLEDALTTLAWCWRIERRDGVAIGLTGHDRDLFIDGLTYRAAPGMVPGAIERRAELDGEGMSVSGALSHAAIEAEALIAGRWDGARVRLFAVDWTDPEGTQWPQGEGTIGAIDTGAGGFSAELNGVAAALNQPVVEATSAGCRATLGDRRCRVPMAGRRMIARVTSMADGRLAMDRPLGAPGRFAQGRLRWISGGNSGIDLPLAGSDAGGVTPWSPPRYPVAGALVELIEGCDRRLATCAGRFGNAVNFQGEPHLPGMDLLTRYPGG